MLANLMHVAGVKHVITVDLHATQSQGFFKCPVDNLIAEPTIAKWIKSNVKDWKEAVVVSKNPGGTKRVTSLADALKLSFGIVTTDTRRPRLHSHSVDGSFILPHSGGDATSDARSESSFQNDAHYNDSHRKTSDVRDYAATNGSSVNDDDVFAPSRNNSVNGTSGNSRALPFRTPPSGSIPNSAGHNSEEDLSLGRVRTALATTSPHTELTTSDVEAESGDEFTDEVSIKFFRDHEYADSFEARQRCCHWPSDPRSYCGR